MSAPPFDYIVFRVSIPWSVALKVSPLGKTRTSALTFISAPSLLLMVLPRAIPTLLALLGAQTRLSL